MPKIYPGTPNEKNVQGGHWAPVIALGTPNSEQREKLQRVQARVVQHHYVRAQLHVINTGRKGGLEDETLAALKMHAMYHDKDTEYLRIVLDHLTKTLKGADLTINFTAQGFFGSPNTSTSYTQMYERAVRPVNFGLTQENHMRLKGDLLNPAVERAEADNNATFRNDQTRQFGFRGKFEGLGRVMSPGPLRAPTVDAKPGEFEATNIYFNPKSKQVFAALNYGRRPHGACKTYGQSFFVLKEKFKTNAIYFAGDTFQAKSAGAKVSAAHQVSYDLLGAIYGKAQQCLRDELIKGCVEMVPLTDDAGEIASNLIEAHLFEPLNFRNNIEKICLSRGDTHKSRTMKEDQWQTVVKNANDFAAINGATVELNT